jgi:hypothetical protein
MMMPVRCKCEEQTVWRTLKGLQGRANSGMPPFSHPFAKQGEQLSNLWHTT